MKKGELKIMLGELYKDFWEQESKIHGYNYDELSFSADSFLRWLNK